MLLAIGFVHLAQHAVQEVICVEQFDPVFPGDYGEVREGALVGIKLVDNVAGDVGVGEPLTDPGIHHG